MAQINSVLDSMTYRLTDSGNYIKAKLNYGKGKASDDKLFTELVVFDSQTYNKLQPFITGRGIFVVGQMPKHMEILYPKETAYFKVLTSTSIIGKSGLELAYEDRLKSTDGIQIYIADEKGNLVTEIAKQEQKDDK